MRPSSGILPAEHGDSSVGTTMAEVKLYGTLISPYSTRVKLALKLKGVPFDYQEEDLGNKSEDLLRYNPIHKKVPVLVHNGKPIVESLIILQYIEETWKEHPLLPEDPYLSARVRFWANFYDSVMAPIIGSVWRKEGEEQDKTVKELSEKLNVLEAGLSQDFSGGTPYLHGEQPGFLDFVLGSSLCLYGVIEEVFKIQLLDQERFPVLFKWSEELKSQPLVRDTLPSPEIFAARILSLRERVLKSAKA